MHSATWNCIFIYSIFSNGLKLEYIKSEQIEGKHTSTINQVKKLNNNMMKDQDGNTTQGEQQNPNTSIMNCIEGIENPPEQLLSTTWEKIEKNIPRTIATYMKQNKYDIEEYNNRFTISQDSPYILEIKNSSTFDEGLYACTIKYNLSTGGIGTFRIFKKLEVPSIPNRVIITINNDPLQGEIV